EHLFLRLFAHRTGIEQDHIRGFGTVHPGGTALLGEHVDHSGRVVLVHLASPSLDEYLHLRTFRITAEQFYFKCVILTHVANRLPTSAPRRSAIIEYALWRTASCRR